METSKIKLIREELQSKLSHDNLKNMDRQSFKIFINEFFHWLNCLKEQGLQKEDLIESINEISYIQAENFDDDIIFEQRLTSITEEVICFCPSPFFWDIDLKEYLLKWENWFNSNIMV